MSEAKKTGTSLALILLLCLAVRVGYDLWRSEHPGFIPGDGYLEIAQNILTGKGFSPTPLQQFCFRTPGYPLLIAAVWSVVPTSGRYAALMVSQLILSTATCGLLFVIANTVFGRRAALAGALLFALSPSVIAYCAEVRSENLHLFWIALAVLTAMDLYRRGNLPMAVILGLIWGAAGLTRPEATLVLSPLLLPMLVAKQRTIPRKALLCVAALLGKIAVMAPWVARNWLVYGTFVLHVPLGGLGLFAGTYPYPPRFGMHATVPEPVPFPLSKEYREITGPFWDPEFLPLTAGGANRSHRPEVEGMPPPNPHPSILITRSERDMLEVDRRLAAAAVIHVKNHKLLELYNILRNFSALWGRPAAWWSVELPGSLRIAWWASYMGLLALFVLGVSVAWKSGKLGVIPLSWLILIAVHTAVLLAFHTEPRYQVTSALFLYSFSGLGIATILRLAALGASTAAAVDVVAAARVGS